MVSPVARSCRKMGPRSFLLHISGDDGPDLCLHFEGGCVACRSIAHVFLQKVADDILRFCQTVRPVLGEPSCYLLCSSNAGFHADRVHNTAQLRSDEGASGTMESSHRYRRCEISWAVMIWFVDHQLPPKGRTQIGTSDGELKKTKRQRGYARHTRRMWRCICCCSFSKILSRVNTLSGIHTRQPFRRVIRK